MKNEDLIQVVYTAEEMEQVKNSLNQLEALANKYRPNLTAEERSSYGTIKELNKLFVNKSKILMEQNSNLVPPFLDMEEFNRDFTARKNIEDVLLRIDRIVRDLSDIKILLDNDNYQDSLAFYRGVRYWAKEKQDGAIAVYNQLKVFFPNGKRKNDEEQNAE